MGATRTSATDPLRLDWIYEGNRGGGFSLTHCPGKQCSGTAGMWHRDLDTDLDALVQAGVSVIVPLLPKGEMRRIGVPELVPRALAHNLRVLAYPFPDAGVPDDLKTVDDLLSSILGYVANGKRLAIFCRGGLGRAGLVASCLLLKLGRFRNAGDAIAEVRRLRSPAAIETLAQEAFVARYASHRRARHRMGRSG